MNMTQTTSPPPAVLARTLAPPSAASLRLEPELPEITPGNSLNGWHRELCVELLGDGGARIFVRAVQQASYRATELQRGLLFQRLDVRFKDLEAFVQAQRADLEKLASTARRSVPSKANLFVALSYDRAAWDRLVQAIERWARR